MQQTEGQSGRLLGAAHPPSSSSHGSSQPVVSPGFTRALPSRSLVSSFRCGSRVMLAANAAILGLRCGMAIRAPAMTAAAAAFSTQPSTTPKPGFAPGARGAPPPPPGQAPKSPPPPGAKPGSSPASSTPSAPPSAAPAAPSAAAAAATSAPKPAGGAGAGAGAPREPPPVGRFSLPPGVEKKPSGWSKLGWLVPLVGLPLLAAFYNYQLEFDKDWDRKVQEAVKEIKQRTRPAAPAPAPPPAVPTPAPQPAPPAPAPEPEPEEAPAAPPPPPPPADAAAEPSAPAAAVEEAAPAAPEPEAAPAEQEPAVPVAAEPEAVVAAVEEEPAAAEAAGAILTAMEAAEEAASAPAAAAAAAAVIAAVEVAPDAAPQPAEAKEAEPKEAAAAEAAPAAAEAPAAVRSAAPADVAAAAAAVLQAEAVPAAPLPEGLPEGLLGLEGFDLSALGLVRSAAGSAGGAVVDWSQWPERHAQAVADSKLIFEALEAISKWHQSRMSEVRGEAAEQRQRAEQLQADREAAVARFKALLRQYADSSKEMMEIEVRQAEKRTRLASEQTRLAEARQRGEALEALRLALGALKLAHETRVQQAAASQAGHALAAGAAAVAAAAESGAPVGGGAGTASLRGLAAQDALVGAVVSALPEGPVATRAQLQERFRGLRGDLGALGLLPRERAGILAVAVARLAAWLKADESQAVRVLGAQYGAGGVAAALARTEALLAEGQLPTAAEELAAALKGTAAEALAADWVAEVRRRASAEATVAALNAHATATWAALA